MGSMRTIFCWICPVSAATSGRLLSGLLAKLLSRL
jgi:hypothetical protein